MSEEKKDQSAMLQEPIKQYAVSSYFRNGNKYTNHLKIVRAASDAEAIGLFLKNAEVRKTIAFGSVMIGNPPACVEVPVIDESQRSAQTEVKVRLDRPEAEGLV